MGQPNDGYEKEADAMAEKVVKQPKSSKNTPAIQPKCEACEQEEKLQKMEKEGEAVMEKPVLGSSGDPIEDQIQMKSFSPNIQLTPDLENKLDCSTGAARHLRENTRKDIYFNQGKFDTRSPEGNRLLAHELTHVVQQRNVYPVKTNNFNITESSKSSLIQRVKCSPRGEDTIKARTMKPLPSIGKTSFVPSKMVQLSAQPDITEELHENWLAESNAAEKKATTGATSDDRAHGRRLWILLNELAPGNFRSETELVNFLQMCHETSESEDKTLIKAARRLSKKELLESYPEGFINTWADKVEQIYNLDIYDLSALYQTYQLTRSQAKGLTAGISNQVWNRGLPLIKNQALRLASREIVGLVLNFARVMKSSSDAITIYTKALFQWLRTSHHYSFIKHFQSIGRSTINSVRRGDFIVTPENFKLIQVQSKRFHDRIKVYDRASSTPNDLKRAFHALNINLSDGKFKHKTLGNLTYSWPSEGIEGYLKEIKEVDALIAAASTKNTIKRAFIWAHEGGFFSAAGREIWKSIKQNGWLILAMAVGIIVAQFIPGLNIALDIVLIIEFGLSAIAAGIDLASSLKDAGSAKSVLDLERASARLAQVLVGTAADIMMWALTFGAGKFVGRVAKYRRGDKFIKKHGNSEDARKALSDSKGDAAKAERVLSKKKDQTVGQKSANLPKLPKELAGACKIGSINCGKIPSELAKEAGSYPSPRGYTVPKPTGPFKIRKSTWSGVSRSTSTLRRIVLTNPSRWFPEFKRALAKANGGMKNVNQAIQNGTTNKLAWPTDRYGIPWQVHHNKPVFFGGNNRIDNLIPLPERVHREFTNYWNGLHRSFKKRFSKAEWEKIYSLDTKDVTGSNAGRRTKKR